MLMPSAEISTDVICVMWKKGGEEESELCLYLIQTEKQIKMILN